MSDEVRYEERGAIAIITLNRPDRLNTLTEAVVQGVADGIDAATASKEVRAIVLRGEGRVFTAGYDLVAGADGGWASPYDAPSPKAREGAWDPVRDYQWMNTNVQRFMKIWHCPKPVVGQVHGYADRGARPTWSSAATSSSWRRTPYIGYAPSRIFGTPTTMMWVVPSRSRAREAVPSDGRGDRRPDGAPDRPRLASACRRPTFPGPRSRRTRKRFKTHPREPAGALNKLLINQAFENMGLRTTQLLGTLFDGVTRHTEEAYQWAESFREKGFRQVIRERDAPFGDYGERKRK